MHHGLSASRFALALLSLAWSGPIEAQSAALPRLAGRWVLNVELSDQMEDRLREALLLGAFSTRVRADGASGSNTKPPPDDRELVGMLVPVLQLVVNQDDSTVSMSDAGGFMVTYWTDGRKAKEYLLSGEVLEISTKWKDRRLTIERKQNRVGSAQESYALDPASGRLVIQVKLRTATLPRTLDFRRVYDPAPGS